MSGLIVVLAFLFLKTPCLAEENPPSGERMLTVFWNLENLFYPEKDSTYVDVEYLPDAPKHWTWGRYRRKMNEIVSTLLSLRDCTGVFPDAIGLAEVENSSVLKNMIFTAPFSKLGYSFVHYESPDRRGIDVGFLYRRKRLRVIDSRAIKVPLSGGKPTRDILYVRTEFLASGDTVHFFVNHWPSKFGGAEESAVNRNSASKTLAAAVDSVIIRSEHPAVVVMGDFNDSKESAPVAALKELLEFPRTDVCSPLDIAPGEIGTNKFRNRWDQIDLIMYRGEVSVEGGCCRIYAPGFLLVEDSKFSGYRVFRTFQGPHYAGGISDHLPVFCSFIFSLLNPKASCSLESPIGSM